MQNHEQRFYKLNFGQTLKAVMDGKHFSLSLMETMFPKLNP